MLNEMLVDPEHGLFVCLNKNEQTFFLSPCSNRNQSRQLLHLFAVGRLLGRALLEGSMMSFHLAPPLLKLVLGHPLSFADVEDLDPEMYTSLLWLLENQEIDTLGLDFTVTVKDGEGYRDVELVPGGGSISVTDGNKYEYVERKWKFLLVESVAPQLGVFLQGLYEIIPRELLLLFDPEELDFLLCGSDEIDVDDWERSTKYTEELHQHRALIWFWELVRDMPNEYRRRLLQFATGTLANAAVTSSSICSSAEFQALPGTRLGDGPVFIRALVQSDEICIEYQLETSVASEATWFGVGPSRGSDMVSSPSANVLLFQKADGAPVSYLLGGYVNSDIAAENDQSTFVLGEASAANMSFSYQRTLAAATTSEVALDATGTADFIWAYGTSWPISSHRSGTNGAATFTFATAGSSSSNGATSTTVGGSSTDTPFCDDKNCPAIVGGTAFTVMALCGLLITAALKTTPVGTFSLYRSVAPPPVRLTTNALVAKPHTMLMQTAADLHFGELLIALVFVAAVIVLIVLLSDEDDYVTSGQVSLLILMFLLLPVSRLPAWSILFGSSFERIVKFHRWLGFLMNVAVIVHLVQARKVVDATLNEKYGSVTPVYGFIAFLCFIVMLAMSLEFVRRLFFEVFYFTHRVLSIVGFVFTILHAPSFIGPALCVPLALYVIGLLYRWSSAFTASYKVSATVSLSSGSTTLVLEPTPKSGNLAKRVNPGSYFLVRLPAISAIQWHPFSSIVTPDGKSLGFCVKAMGNGSFTRKLLTKAGTQYNLSANLCGPFGKISLDVERYDAVVLVAGGVGITPMMNLINQTRLFPSALARSDKAAKASDWYVVWSVREPEDILMMEEFLPTQAQIEGGAHNLQDPNTAILGSTGVQPININWMFHVSTARSDGMVARTNGETVSYRRGRPVLDEVINMSRFGGRRVTVMACGPPTMTVEAQLLARNCNFDFHKETFNW
ncbi:hypothetical protein BBO99_00001720 [Phytophthora kernoviae]|uniref:HECT-type E3 ubiquitin transferase n=2 Tax=Phytophthora kernoviae TaxID=325452 RepID=A0A421FBQ3_9STRA|nr:hypothetical protein G195_002297 [Phytophthora kernoviae 00238/432]KAG2532002.1 hypothetical protein JM18_001511 [Phytophthora kernoviae]RLN36744.1 hypothetical protein BBI17_001528 [Phytophthora kernoviae]RLN83903.1 hypothetical protein BBO99_00001720 [Phytophthora kernoviae]